ELAALIRMDGVISFSQQKQIYTLDVQSENAAIARRIYTLIKASFYVSVALLVRKKIKLTQNKIYIVRLKADANQVLRKLDMSKEPMHFVRRISEKYLEKEFCQKAYLRGAFLAGGSINNPETSSYHLEIFNFYEDHNESLCDLLNIFDLRARKHERRNGYIVYIKEAEKITKFLNIIGANNDLFKIG